MIVMFTFHQSPLVPLDGDPEYPNIPLQIDSSFPPSPRQPKSTHLPAFTHPQDSLPCTWNGPKQSAYSLQKSACRESEHPLNLLKHCLRIVKKRTKLLNLTQTKTLIFI
ncbi:hypothetical protein TNCV_1774611 [Trichonephila clavipes]|nr:hypothetical protein TNCV_1774611 [Trichonephila clavipes]